MINRMLEAILRGMVILHQENVAIAKEISGNEGIESLWNDMFFSAIKDVVSAEDGGDVESEKIPKNKKTSSATRSKGEEK